MILPRSYGPATSSGLFLFLVILVFHFILYIICLCFVMIFFKDAKKMAKKEKVVLAYSGGLDTSVILPWLKETYGYDVIAFAAELGQGDELSGIKKKALASGAVKCIVKDLRKEFVEDYLWKMLKAGRFMKTGICWGQASPGR